MLNPDQLVDLLSWLENLYDNGATLEDVIDGVKDGSLTAADFSLSESDQDLSEMS